MAGRYASGGVFHVFAHHGAPAEDCHQQEEGARNFKPQLVKRLSERTGRGAHPGQDRAYSPVAAGVLLGYSGCCPDLS